MKSRIFLFLAIVSVAGMLAMSGCHREDDEESWGGNVRISRATGELAGHGYVDLGLPSGILWATCNVGADSPQEYGDYFAWGETEAKGNYDKYTYKYYKYDYNYYSYSDETGPFRLTKYCPRYDAEYYGYNNFYDDLTTLEPSDDAATVNWGNEWRMPTIEECQELFDNCVHKSATYRGIHGRHFTGPNGNSIFLPAAGYRDGYILDGENTGGGYWASTLSMNRGMGVYFGFGSGSYDVTFSYFRENGFSVRPVCVLLR
mgnify:CR=1 FL=1